MTPIHTHDPQKTAGREGWGCLRGDCARHSLADHESQGRENGSRVVCMPRHLALFYPDETLGRGALASNPRPFPQIQIRAGGVLPPTCTARHGVEHDSGLRHAASHTRVLLVPCLDARSGRVLSARKRSALPVIFHTVHHVPAKFADGPKTAQLKRLSKCSGSDDPTHSERRLAACSPNQRNQFPL